MKLFSIVTATSAVLASGAPYITEIDYDQPGTDNTEFVEVAVPAADAALLPTLKVYPVNKACGQYKPPLSLATDGVEGETVDGVTYYTVTFPPNSITNSGGGVVLYQDGTTYDAYKFETDEPVTCPEEGGQTFVRIEAEESNSEPNLSLQLVNGVWVANPPTLGLANGGSAPSPTAPSTPTPAPTINLPTDIEEQLDALTYEPRPITGNKVRVLHLNDFHARIEGMTSGDGPCAGINEVPDAGYKICDGGWPRIVTAAKAMVAEAAADGFETIFVDDGDQFMGSVWSNYYLGLEASIFLNYICSPVAQGGAGFAACVGTLGNHEWDYKYMPLLDHIKTVNYPMVSTNTIDECAANSQGEHAEKELGAALSKSVVLDGGVVAILGYTTPETKDIASPPGCVSFQEEKDAIIAEVAALPDTVKVVIVLGHSGYLKDQDIAKSLSGVDLIVGGHSHSLLWDEATMGPNPVLNSGDETPVMGSYPTVTNDVNIVQAYWGGRFLGASDLEWDAEGKITSFTPKMTYLAAKDVTDGAEGEAAEKYRIEEDAGTRKIVEALLEPLDAFRGVVVGKASTYLTGTGNVGRFNETNMGNMICDAMIDAIDKRTSFATPDLCLMNSGGIRIDLPAGNVTVGDVLGVLPFGNVLSVIEITSRQLWLMLEHGVSRWGERKGEFGQFGRDFRFVFDPSATPACGFGGAELCDVNKRSGVRRVMAVYYKGAYVPFDSDRTFTMVTNDYLTRGGDGYTLLVDAPKVLATGEGLFDAVKTYIEDKTATEGGVAPVRECRILNVLEPYEECPSVESLNITRVCENREGIVMASTGKPKQCSELTEYCATSTLVQDRCAESCGLCGQDPCLDAEDPKLELANGTAVMCADAALYCNLDFVAARCPGTCDVCSTSAQILVTEEDFAAPGEATPLPEPTTPGTGNGDDDDDDTEESSGSGAIVGGVIGGIALIGLAAGAFVYYKKQLNAESQIDDSLATSKDYADHL